MANKISAAMDNLEEALQDLVTDGTLKAVKRTVINPLTAMQRPVLGLKIVQYKRECHTWTVEVLLTLVTMAGQAADDEANIDLAAKVDAAIQELADSGDAGAALDAPTWQPWEWRDKADGPLMPVGSLGGLKMRVDDPLLIEEQPGD